MPVPVRVERPEPLPNILAQRAATTPEAPYLAEVGGTSLTYGEFYQQVRRWVAGLRSAGVSAGDFVGVVMRPCMANVAVWAAISMLRATEVPLNPDLPAADLGRFLAAAGARYAVADRESAAAVRQVVSLAQLAGVAGPEPATAGAGTGTALGGSELPGDAEEGAGRSPVRDWENATVLFTSGTTGAAKPFLVSWRQLAAVCQNYFPAGALTAADGIYSTLGFYYVAGKYAPYLAALLGSRCVIRPSFDPVAFWADMDAYDCTTTALVGTMADLVLEAADSRPRRAENRLNALIVPRTETAHRFVATFGGRTCTAYGVSEVGCPVGSGWSTPPGSSGQIKPGYEFQIVDAADYPVPAGKIGEIVFRAEPWLITPGYIGAPDRFLAATRNGWFHTGDLFRADTEGNLYFVDRKSDAVGGATRPSGEIEAAIGRHPSVAQVSVVAMGEDTSTLRAFITGRRGCEVGLPELVAFLGRTLADDAIPRYFEVLSDFPRTVSFKIRKDVLRSLPVTPATFDRLAAGQG